MKLIYIYFIVSMVYYKIYVQFCYELMLLWRSLFWYFIMKLLNEFFYYLKSDNKLYFQKAVKKKVEL